jgi:hypothetical protein
MNEHALTKLKAALSNASTMEEFLRICGEHYDFKNARLGTASKALLVNGIGTVIALSGAKPKTK